MIDTQRVLGYTYAQNGACQVCAHVLAREMLVKLETFVAQIDQKPETQTESDVSRSSKVQLQV